MPHREYPHLAGTKDVIDVVPSHLEQDTTSTWDRGTLIEATDAWRVADDVERCSQFLGKQVR